jgi:peptidyl-prolyl cis-trans isomerase SurA
VAPKPSREAKDSVMKLADSLVLALRSGADFATTARQWSQDPGSRELGGSLGWARRGVWVPAFERVAFAMRPGFVSSPVESPFGVHIIQVERVQPGEVSARHILLIPTLTQDSITAARRTADEVRAALAAGAAFDSLAKAHHDPSEQREFGESAVDRLAEPYKTLLAEAKPGEVPAVAEVEVGPVTKYVVVQVVNRRDDGETRFEDVKDQVREQLGQQLGVRRYLDALRSASYVEIRAT